MHTQAHFLANPSPDDQLYPPYIPKQPFSTEQQLLKQHTVLRRTTSPSVQGSASIPHDLPRFTNTEILKRPATFNEDS